MRIEMDNYCNEMIKLLRRCCRLLMHRFDRKEIACAAKDLFVLRDRDHPKGYLNSARTEKPPIK